MAKSVCQRTVASLLAVVTMALMVSCANGHGYILNPASRNFQAKKAGFYEPMSLNSLGTGQCGGLSNSDGRFAAGGVYATRNITGNYVEGGVMHTQTQIWIKCASTNRPAHWGWFEFRLCPLTKPSSVGEKAQISEACFAAHVLKQTDGSGSRHWINHGLRSAHFVESASYQLPPGVTCKRCVLQWIWVTAHACKLPGNPSNFMTDGLQGLHPCPANYMAPSLALPEKFYNCADISIHAASKRA